MKALILVIASNQELGYSLTDLFQPEGFSVIQVIDSSEGVTHVMENAPDVILMSEDMPPLDGVELLPLLRRITTVPIIVVGAGGETAVVKALLLGADVYLSLPINYRELLSRVRSLLRNTQNRQGNSDDNDNSTNNLRRIEPSGVLPAVFSAREAGAEEGLLNFVSRGVARTLRSIFGPMPAT